MYRDLPKNIQWSIIDRWATHPLLVKTFATRIQDELKKFPEDKRKDVILLFSAHSIPLKVITLVFFLLVWLLVFVFLCCRQLIGVMHIHLKLVPQ